jgi:hypothetical protein
MQEVFRDHLRDSSYRQIWADGSWQVTLPDGTVHTGSSENQEDALLQIQTLHDEWVVAIWRTGEMVPGVTRSFGGVTKSCGNAWFVPIFRARNV